MSSLPTLLVVDPKSGYKFVKRNDDPILYQLYELIGCDSIQLLFKNPLYPDDDMEIYCDEEGLLKDGLGMNCYIHPFIEEKLAMRCIFMGGPRGVCVIISKKFTPERLLNMFPEEIWDIESKDYISSMEKAILEYHS